MTFVVERYLTLGLALGRHIDGMVDAYFGPPELAERAERAAPAPPARLVEDARRLLVDLEHAELGAERRRWLAAQVEGLHTTASRLSGEPIGYADEVERCYGVRPVWQD